MVIPGTWESSPDDDPYSPTANPNSLMLRVSKALAGQFDRSRAEIYTVPYTAQFRNPTNLADRQADYNVSRAQGYKRAAGKIIATNKRCPLTRYVIMGFSQGAVIAGDLASNIGNGRGVLADGDQDFVLGVGLIADGRRQPGKQNDIDPSPEGVGAEIALGGMGSIVPGITMTGPRNGGFGELEDRVQSICVQRSHLRFADGRQSAPGRRQAGERRRQPRPRDVRHNPLLGTRGQDRDPVAALLGQERHRRGAAPGAQLRPRRRPTVYPVAEPADSFCEADTLR